MKINIIIKIFITIVSIYLLSKYDFLDFNILFTLNFSLSVKLLGLISLIILLGSIKWYYLLRVQNNNISFRDAFESYYLGYALNYVLFGVAGDIIKTLYIIKKNDNKIGISISVVIDRVIGLFSMLIILLVFLPQILSKNKFFNNNSFIDNINLSMYYFLFSIFFIIFIIFIKKFLNSRRINKAILLFLYKYKNNFIKLIAKTLKILFTYRKSSINLLANLFIAIVVQIIIGYSIYVISLDILSQYPSFFNNLISSIVVQIISVIPISPGNIGIGEAAFSQVMYLLNNNILLQYASVYLIFRIFNMLYSIPGAVIYYLLLKREYKINDLK
jgi:glycosyltransferase 2 family protein